MAYQVPPTDSAAATEQQDRGLFGLFGKKKEEHPEAQCHQQAAAPAPVHFGAPPADAPLHQPHEAYGHGDVKQHGHGLPGKLHRTHSSSSSSSSDEDESGEKKEGGRKKKGLKDKIKEKLPGHHGDDGNKKEGQYQSPDAAHKPDGEKKGVLEKIKEKLPGHHDKEGEGGHYDQEKQQHGY